MGNPANHCTANSKAAENATSIACLESRATGFPSSQHPSPHMGNSFLFHIRTHRPFTMKSLLVNEFYIIAHFTVLLLLFNLMFINVIFIYLIFANILLYECANFIHFTERISVVSNLYSDLSFCSSAFSVKNLTQFLQMVEVTTTLLSCSCLQGCYFPSTFEGLSHRVKIPDGSFLFSFVSPSPY